MTLNVITVQNTTKFLTNVILWKLDFIQCEKKFDILRNMKEEARLLMIHRFTWKYVGEEEKRNTSEIPQNMTFTIRNNPCECMKIVCKSSSPY